MLIICVYYLMIEESKMIKIGSMFLFVVFVLLAALQSPTAADGAVFNNQSPPIAGAAAATATNDVIH